LVDYDQVIITTNDEKSLRGHVVLIDDNALILEQGKVQSRILYSDIDQITPQKVHSGEVFLLDFCIGK
jgi:hypothetical protein